MLFSNMVQSIFLVNELLAALSALYNGMVVDFTGVLYEIIVGIKLGATLVAFMRLVE